MSSGAQKHSLVMPACIVAGGLIIAACIMRSSPSKDPRALPTLSALTNGSTSTGAKADTGRDPALLGSLDSSFVKEVHGDLVTIAYSPGHPKSKAELTLKLTPTTKYIRSERIPEWTDHLLKMGDLIDFTPTDFDQNLDVVEAESVTLIARPEAPPDAKK